MSEERWALVSLAVYVLAGLTLGGCGRDRSSSRQEATSSPPEALSSDESVTLEPGLNEVRAGLATQTKMLALLQHISAGIPLAEIPSNNLRAHLEICAKEFGLRLPREVRDAIGALGGSQALPEDVIESLTGHSKAEWAAVFRKHRESLEAVVSGRAEVWGLPDEIWDYLTAMTGRSPEQWKALPEEVDALIRNGFNCPSCQTHHDPGNMIHPAGGGRTYLGKENPDTLHFTCPKCGKHFTWNVATGATTLQE